MLHMKEWMFIITLAYGNDCSVNYSTLFYTLRTTLFYAVLQAQVHTVVCCSTLFSSTLFHAVCYCSNPVPRCLLLFYSVPRCSIGPCTVPHCSELFYIVTHFSTLFHTVWHSSTVSTLFYSVIYLMFSSCPYCSTLFVQCSALNYIVQLCFIML